MQWFVKILSAFMIKKCKQRQINSDLRKPEIWGLGTNNYGHLTVGEISAIDLIKEYGSPILVVNAKKLYDESIEIKNALTKVASDSKVLYSYKTNCIPGILREIHRLQIGAEVVSPYELWLAERLGVPGEMIVYNGVNKTEESIERAAKLNILAINIDHMEEVERIYRVVKRLGKKIRVGIRLGLNHTSQFGMEIETGEALEACREIALHSDYLDLACVQFNVTSNARSASFHKTCALKAIEFMAQIKEKLNLHIKFLDIGGGFGVPTTKNMSGYEYGLYRTLGCPPKPPSLREFQSIDSVFKEIIESVRKLCKEKNFEIPKILIEPGRAITSRSELLLCSVLTVKNRAKRIKYVITDAGRLSTAFPCDFEYHEVFLANQVEAPITTPYYIMGRVCTSADWMFKNRYLPEIIPGDVLAIMDAGAYFSSYSTNFSFPRPPIVMVSGGKAEIIHQEETFEHLTAMDKM